MGKNRWEVLHKLCGLFWKEDESDLDADDIWRYTRWPLRKFNEHRLVCVEPSDALVSDEGMCAYLGKARLGHSAAHLRTPPPPRNLQPRT